jgi:hypothetical protein
MEEEEREAEGKG